jgi:hypothetical protein
MKIVSSYVNFAKGQVDRDMNGRFDLPIYNTSAEIVRNFKTNFKGNTFYRTAYEQMLVFQDCAFIEFKFSVSQNYIVVGYANKFRFLSYDGSGNFGWVLSGGSPLEVATPYTLAQIKEIARRKQYTQNDDAMQITHKSYAPRSLRRLAADNFELVVTSLKDNPFNLTYDASKTITAITKALKAQITIAAHGYVAGDSFKVTGVSGMTEINDYTVGVVSVVDANNVTVSLDTRDFTAYTSAGTAEKVATASYPNLALYYGAKLYYGASATKITTIWGSEDSEYDRFKIPTSVLATSALQFTLADISQEILWLFAGENSLIAGSADGIVAINGGEVGKSITAESIDTILTSANPASDVYPVTKDGLIFYMDIIKRRMLYFSYDLLTETFKAKDANLLAYEITKGGLEKLRYKRDKEDFIYSLNGNGSIQTLNFNADENIAGWHNHTTSGSFEDIAQITDNDGNPQIFVLSLRNGVYYIEREAQTVEFVKPEEYLSTTKAADKAAYYRMRAEQLKECIYLDNAQIISNLKSNSITFNGTNTITATSSVFSAGDIGKHIVYKTLTGYESGRFEITGYTSGTVVTVTVLQTPTVNTYTNWYLTFSTISGLASAYNGQTLSVVADGGYYGTAVVSGGAIALDRQVTHAVVGYGYTGIVKSFVLGFVIQQYNTQATFKALNRLSIRTTTSLGGKFGTDFYALKDIQKLQQGDINYLPALPLDGTETLPFLDKHEIDKQFYLVQDLPLPFFVTSVIIEANHSVTTG